MRVRTNGIAYQAIMPNDRDQSNTWLFNCCSFLFFSCDRFLEIAWHQSVNAWFSNGIDGPKNIYLRY